MSDTAHTATVRLRRDDDIPGLARVLLRVHAEDGYPVEGVADPAAWLTPARQLAAWTAEINHCPIGHISLTQAGPEDDAARVWAQATNGDMAKLAIPVRLFVDPSHRSSGAGSKLMRAAQRHAAAHGLYVAFDVMLKDHKAIRLYERLGCKRLGTMEHHHSDGQTEPAAVYLATRPDRE